MTFLFILKTRKKAISKTYVRSLTNEEKFFYILIKKNVDFIKKKFDFLAT